MSRNTLRLSAVLLLASTALGVCRVRFAEADPPPRQVISATKGQPQSLWQRIDQRQQRHRRLKQNLPYVHPQWTRPAHQAAQPDPPGDFSSVRNSSSAGDFPGFDVPQDPYFGEDSPVHLPGAPPESAGPPAGEFPESDSPIGPLLVGPRPVAVTGGSEGAPHLAVGDGLPQEVFTDYPQAVSLQPGVFAEDEEASEAGLTIFWQETPLWRPYVEGSMGGGTFRRIGGLDLFLPLAWTDQTLVWTDLRGFTGEQREGEGAYHQGNWALAVRDLRLSRRTSSPWILGGWASFDLRETGLDNQFEQFSLGVEGLTIQREFRLAAYFPDVTPKPVTAATEQRAYRGCDGEFGWLICSLGGSAEVSGQVDPHGPVSPEKEAGHAGEFPLLAELRAFAGAYFFEQPDDDFESIIGPRARLELRLYDLPLFSQGSRVTLEARAQWDDTRQLQGQGMLFVRIPFGPNSGQRLTPIQRRMVDRLVRDVDIVVEEGPR